MKYGFILKMVLRGWWRNKVFFLIAVISLSIGLAGTNLLLTYFIHDYFIERDNPDKERIFCLRQDNPFDDGQKVTYASVEAASDVQKKIPGVESFMQVQDYRDSAFSYKGHTYFGLDMIGADSMLLDFFPLRVLSGDLKQALTTPNKIAIRESVVKRIFGKEDPLGKMIERVTDGKAESYEIVAVWAEQTQSLLKYDLLINKTAECWGGATFLKLLPNVSAEQVEKAIRADKSIQTLVPDRTQYYVDSLSDLYFVQSQGTSQQQLPFIQQSQVQLLYIGLLAAILILVIACCNYTNMNLSRLMQQLKMIHVEKLMGGTLREIRMQLLGDVVLTVVISFLLSLLIIADVLPVFNTILKSRMTFAFFFSGQVLPLLLGFLLVMALVPAWYASRRLMRWSYSEYKMVSTGKGKHVLMAVLVVVQFAISCGLVLATCIGEKQQRMILQQASHYEGLIEMGDMFSPPAAPLKAELEKRVPGIESISLSLGSVLNSPIRELQIPQPDGTEKRTYMLTLYSDSSFLKTMHIRQLTGHSPARLQQEYAYPVLVNESFVRQLVPAGVDPIGRPLQEFDTYADSLYVIGGTVEDFPINSLEKEITPITIHLPASSALGNANVLHIKLRLEDKEETIRQIAQIWEEINTKQAFQYVDMHTLFMERNARFVSFAQVITVYAVIGLLLTLFGLFGITWYATRQRIREISIRKIHGASRWQIVWLLNKPFMVYAVIAYLIALPITYGLLSNWLEQFAYHVSFSILDWLLPFLVIWLVSVITVGIQAYVLMKVDPVKCLKVE